MVQLNRASPAILGSANELFLSVLAHLFLHLQPRLLRLGSLCFGASSLGRVRFNADRYRVGKSSVEMVDVLTGVDELL